MEKEGFHVDNLRGNMPLEGTDKLDAQREGVHQSATPNSFTGGEPTPNFANMSIPSQLDDIDEGSIYTGGPIPPSNKFPAAR